MSTEVSPGTESTRPAALTDHIMSQIDAAVRYTRRRRSRFGRFATVTHLSTLTLSATSTVILGLQELTLWASIAFSLVALTTLFGAVEPFFNWRSRWVLMEDMTGQLLRLKSDLQYFLVRTPPGQIHDADLDGYFTRLQLIWEENSRNWVAARRSEVG